MVFWSSSTVYERACALKQEDRQAKFRAASKLSSPLTASEEKLHALSISELVSSCYSGAITPFEIVAAYGKKALQAQKDTNCIADLMLEEALQSKPIASWAPAADSDSCTSDCEQIRPLLGVPVSLKDTVDIAGHDTTIGFSRNVGKPVSTSSPIVRLLQDAGALIHAKTTIPTALFSVDTESKLFGRTSNPYSSAHGAGASTGGGAALVACGGTKIEIGSDVAGSVRFPAHFCGVWSLKGSVGRFPAVGNWSSMAGSVVPSLTGPLAGSLEDLEEFYKRVIDMKPWDYDFTCVPLPWRPVNLQEEGRKLKWGIIWDDGVIPPSPACRRALSTVAESLKEQGHEVVNFSPPSIQGLLEVGYQLAFADGGEQIQNTLLPSEKLNPALESLFSLVKLPRFIKRLLAMYYRRQDPIYANLLDIMHTKSIVEERDLVVQRDAYRAAWHDQWAKEGLDFVLTLSSPFPAIEHGKGIKASLMSAGYNFIFNLLDYTAGIVPVTNVDRVKDALPAGFFSSPEYARMNNICKTAYTVYDADSMHGLPVGIQIAGRRLEEEKTLEGMKVIQSALKQKGVVFKRRNPYSSS